MNMDVCVKKESQFSRFTGILLPRGKRNSRYIGRAEVLPAPLSQEEEEKKIHRWHKSTGKILSD